jgi:Domain of unknown function (DUF4129)
MKDWRWGAAARSRFFLLAAFIAFSLLCHAQAPTNKSNSNADASALDLQSYQQELKQIEDAAKDPQKIETVRKGLPDAWTVKNSDQTYSVPTKEISEALRQIQSDPKKATLAQLELRLKFMRQQADELAGASEGTNLAQAQDKLNAVLNRSEFREATGPSAWDVIRARINRWILEHVIRLLNWLHIGRKTGNAIGWGVLFLAVVLVFSVVYRWLTKSTKAAEFRAEVEPRGSDTRHWTQEALMAAERGDFREAIHCAYWASIARLEDVRILPQDRARTPRESLQLLDQHPKEQGVLQSVTRSFELIWYGYRPVSATDWAGTKEQLEKMGCLQGSIAPTVPS